MKRRPALPLLMVLLAIGVTGALALAALGCGSDGERPTAGSQSSDLFDGKRAFRDLADQVAIGPRTSRSAGGRKEVELITARLRAAGVMPVEIQRPWRNVIATIPGTQPGVIVAGAHWDTKDSIPGFVGADDGASGVAILLELARSLPSPVDGPSIQLVFFDGEEARGDRAFETDGTRGSRQYVRYAKAGGRQGSAPLRQIKAMALFDMVGDCDLKIPFEGLSDVDLYARFANAAKQANGSSDPAPFEGTAGGGVLDDHIPFVHAGVPAVDLIDFDYGPGPSPGGYWHTPQDTLDKVCPASLDAVGEASVRALPGLAQAPAKGGGARADG